MLRSQEKLSSEQQHIRQSECAAEQEERKSGNRDDLSQVEEFKGGAELGFIK